VTDEATFLQRCIRLHCVQSCPTQIIRATGLEAGVSSLFTPSLTFTKQGSDSCCQVCQQVCPNAAIPLQRLEEKQRAVIGLASIGETQCLVCEEMCPIPEKAILFEERAALHRVRHLSGELPGRPCRDHRAQGIVKGRRLRWPR